MSTEDRLAELESLVVQLNESYSNIQRELKTIQDSTDVFNTGDIAWMLASSALVIFMTLPGLALFYAGMVRIQNVLATVMQSVSIACVITLLWFICGYSLTWSPAQESSCEGLSIIGNLDKFFLKGMFLNNGHQLQQTIPETLFCFYELSFAIITPALICGAFADRMKYSAMLWFMVAWHICVYCPIRRWNAHPCGFLYDYSMDFAGGNSVHICAGMAGLVCALTIGNRSGYGKEIYLPHNVLISVMGACMLWVGWFGFNAGSALGADNIAAVAMLNTQISAGCAGLTWTLTAWYVRGQPSVLGMVTGAIGGLVCITPAAGFVDPFGAFVIGMIGGPVCYAGCQLKNWLLFDDSLDAFGLHAVGGVFGGIMVGLLSTGHDNHPSGLFYGNSGDQLGKQVAGILVTATWSVCGTFIVLKIVDFTVGLRVSEINELSGLDEAFHGESMIAGQMVTSAFSKGSIFGGVDYAAVDLECILELPSLLKKEPSDSPAEPEPEPVAVAGDPQQESPAVTKPNFLLPSPAAVFPKPTNEVEMIDPKELTLG